MAEAPWTYQIGSKGREIRRVPSRYNLRTTTSDGRLVLWNSLSGALNVFEPAQKDAVLRALSPGGSDGAASRPRRLVDYLADRGFLVPEGSPEYQRMQLTHGRQQHRTDQLHLTLLASEDCNFRCVYCYEGFSRGTMEPGVRRGIRRLVERRAPGLRGLSVSWFGGEPLCGMEAIEDLAPFFVELERDHDLALVCHMTTNGFLLTRETAERLLSWHIRHFQITLDGPQEQHDLRRPRRDGRPTFATILDNLRDLGRSDQDFSVILRANFDRGNRSHILSLLDFLVDELGTDPRFRLSFRAVGRWGGPNDDRLDTCDRDEAAATQRWLERRALERDLRLASTIRHVNLPGRQVCYAARPYHFVVGADGTLMKCTVLVGNDERNLVGRLSEDGELLIDEDLFARWVQPFFESDAACRKCVLLPTCQGGFCPADRLKSGSRSCPGTRTWFKYDLETTSMADRAKIRHVTLRPEDFGSDGERRRS